MFVIWLIILNNGNLATTLGRWEKLVREGIYVPTITNEYQHLVVLTCQNKQWDFPDGSVGKESACNSAE